MLPSRPTFVVTRAVVSCTDTPTAEFTRNRDWHFPLAGLQRQLSDTLGADHLHFIDAQHLATRLMGDALYANMLLLGYAWQMGLVPVSATALEQAIALNGAAVDANRQAFAWGRRAAVFPDQVAAIAGPLAGQPTKEMTLAELIEHRATHLAAYQDARLAERYRLAVGRIEGLGDTALTRSVATQYARLLAPKDEYEVARLYTEGDFMRRLGEQFAGEIRLNFLFAPPLLAKPGPDGRPRKLRFGPWLLPILRLLAKARGLRGTWADPFRRTPDKALDRRLLADYEADLKLILAHPDQPDQSRTLADWPAEVRGFGPLREQAARQASARRERARSALMA